MGIGASSEVLTEDQINQEVKKEMSSRSKSKKGEKSTKASKGMEKNASQEEKKSTSKASGMKRDAVGGTLEERGVLALERVATSM